MFNEICLLSSVYFTLYIIGSVRDNIEGYHSTVLSDFAAEDLTALDTWALNRVCHLIPHHSLVTFKNIIFCCCTMVDLKTVHLHQIIIAHVIMDLKQFPSI